MDQDNNHIDWNKVLDELDKRSGVQALTAQEEELKKELLKLKGETADLLVGYRDYHTEAHWDKLSQHLSFTSPNSLKSATIESPKIALWPRIGIAVAVVFILSIGTYFLWFNSNQKEQMVQLKTKDILPGTNKAILTTANNQKITLSEEGNRDLGQQGNAVVVKDKDGSIHYQALKGQSAKVVVYNTVTTPRGGVYQLTLADGTQVNLNAGSSITYPTTFSGSERKVSVTGELYFEVAHHKNMPFKVVSANQTIEVLGTHFNINTYADEPATKTTLLEGSVKLTNHLNQTLYLKPGQQAQNGTNLSLVTGANAEAAVAWNNGFFHFENADIATIMRAFARWYNVDVVFNGKSNGRRFTGDIHRNMKLSRALEVLSYLKIHFSIEANKIVVIQ
jgi:transmembrane sensor